jgi:uncharacterized protein
MLAPHSLFEHFVTYAKTEMLKVGCEPAFYMQTNGTLFDEAWCALFKRLDIGIGISIDGTEKAHDTFRVDHAGRGSYHKVMEGLRMVRDYFGAASVITVMNFEEPLTAIYENLKAERIAAYNILLPDYHYEHARPYFQEGQSDSPFGDELIRLFDRWFDDPDESRPTITLFKGIIDMMLGQETAGNELLGSMDNTVLVLETDGSLEAVDTLKICGDSFTKAGVNVLTHTIEDALNTPLAQTYYQSHSQLCSQCKVCPLNSICGGGYLPHRFSKANGFDNPSVYCPDLMVLLVHIQNRLFSLFPESARQEANIELISLAEVKAEIAAALASPISPSPSTSNAVKNVI